MASASSTDGPGVRSWWTLVGGVAIVSSAVTTFSILGIQRIHRKQRRVNLDNDVRKATNGDAIKQRQKDGDHNEHSGSETKSEAKIGDSAVPKYLAALAASQDGISSSPSTPRFVTSNSVRSQHLARQPSLHLRPSLSAASSSREIQPPDLVFDESLIREQLSRNYSFLGDEAMDKVRNSFVIVVGAGGVGSSCALMLLRSGVGKLRLIDFDQVSLSSLNRHSCANLADVGRPKVTVCKEHFAQIAPWADVDAQVEIFRGSDAERLFGPSKVDASGNSMEPTYVIDAIDNLETKVDLLAYCYKNKIKCFSSMGAGAKADPGQIQIADLNLTAEDPLARRVRRSLRAQYIWTGGAMLSKKEAKEAGLLKEGHLKKKSKAEKKQAKEASDLNNGRSAQAKKEDDVQATLAKLESKDNSTTAEMKQQLQSSGRGAEAKNRQPSSSLEAITTRPNDSENAGFSRYTTSRRASTASSRNSSQFFSPLSTPDEEGSRSLDTQELKDGIEEVFSLPEAVQSIQGTQEVTDESTPKRPSLSTLLTRTDSSSSSEAGPSRRTSSLKELVAEDTRSSQSGRLARRSMSGQPPAMEDVTEEEAVEDDEHEREEPFKIMCVYSNEKSDTRLLPLDESEFQKGNVEELAALEDFRVRILPVLGPLPAMFGLAAATYVICDIAGRQLETVPWKNRRKTYEKLWTELEVVERRYPVPGSEHDKIDVGLGPRRIPWSIEDVGYVYEEVYRGRSVIPPYETLLTSKMLRWDSTLPLSYSNVALFNRAQGLKHEQEVLKLGRSPVAVWGDDAYYMFKRRMAEERRMNILR